MTCLLNRLFFFFFFHFILRFVQLTSTQLSFSFPTCHSLTRFALKQLAPLRTLWDLSALIVALNLRHISASVIESQCCLCGPIHACRATVVCYNKRQHQNGFPTSWWLYLLWIGILRKGLFNFQGNKCYSLYIVLLQAVLRRCRENVFKKCIFSSWIAKLCKHIHCISSSLTL